MVDDSWYFIFPFEAQSSSVKICSWPQFIKDTRNPDETAKHWIRKYEWNWIHKVQVVKYSPTLQPFFHSQKILFTELQKQQPGYPVRSRAKSLSSPVKISSALFVTSVCPAKFKFSSNQTKSCLIWVFGGIHQILCNCLIRTILLTGYVFTTAKTAWQLSEFTCRSQYFGTAQTKFVSRINQFLSNKSRIWTL